MLIKPKRLQPGDIVATVSPSWGGAGDAEIRWRYEQGVKRLEEVFSLTVIPMPNSLKGSEYLYNNPEARAEDIMTAFKDTRVKAIIANIGGEDSIRLLPYIDFNVIRENPKIFMGYSDVTITHLFCHKAGLSSLYGPAILTDFAENVEMDPYTIEMVNRTLFSNETIGEIQPAHEWTSEHLEWIEINKDTRRTMQQNNGYEVLQGSTTVQGRLIGGCIEVLEFAKGIIFGKPKDEQYYEEYKQEILQVMKEHNLEDLPILYNLNFGHTEPKFILPYGAMAEIDCENGSFSILESGVE
ncbi:LD-carboxypeptidase [Bacillus cereus]|uniref:S66 family peptidase n=1 Tax=Bacillus cereus TaxID=1396 RepID=UPI0011229CF1|nr:S66 peptidase family protein [Bacillus cereus]UDW01425.1 LD-carboxypeptidase [Bacillus cereus]